MSHSLAAPKRLIRSALVALAMAGTMVAIAPQAVSAAPQAAPVAAQAQAPSTDRASLDWSFYCTYTYTTGYGGGFTATCDLDRTYMNWYSTCSDGYTYYSGWGGPYGRWYFWSYCPSSAYLVSFGYLYSYF